MYRKISQKWIWIADLPLPCLFAGGSFPPYVSHPLVFHLPRWKVSSIHSAVLHLGVIYNYIYIYLCSSSHDNFRLGKLHDLQYSYTRWFIIIKICSSGVSLILGHRRDFDHHCYWIGSDPLLGRVIRQQRRFSSSKIGGYFHLCLLV